MRNNYQYSLKGLKTILCSILKKGNRAMLVIKRDERIIAQLPITCSAIILVWAPMLVGGFIGLTVFLKLKIEIVHSDN